MPDLGRETVVFFEVDQPLCVHAWGDGVGSPSVAGGCPAVLGVDGDRKCFNTRSTCAVPASYSAGTLTLRFSRSQEGLQQYGNLMPQIVGSPGTTPGSINLAGMDTNAGALGIREAVDLTLRDQLHSDLLVDPYRLERKTGSAAVGSPPETYDPYTRGTFWGKWISRNPYYSGYPCRIREGFVGDDLEDMRARHYVIDRIDGPSVGMVKIVLKDLFSKIEALKAQAPLPSLGELNAGILAAGTSATLAPAGIGNAKYPASGYVAMGDEMAGFTRSGDVLTLSRGAFGTEAVDHDAEDLVQLVLEYTADSPHLIIYDLLVNYSSIQASSIDLAEWTTLASGITELYTARIAKPTAVLDLIAEICEQAGITVWPDVSTGTIRFAALRPTSASVTVTDDGWIVDSSLKLQRKSEKRASEVWVYYGQKNPVKDLDDEHNYHSRLVEADLEAEGDDQYGSAAIRKVFSRWIPQFGRQFAEQVGERILAMFRDVPTEASFSIHASRDGELDLAAPFTLRTADVQDETGDVLDVIYMPIEIERGENLIGVTAQQITFSGGGLDVGGFDRVINIENDAFNLNLLSIHDSLFTPTETSSPHITVTFIVLDGVTVGSTSTSSSAMRTGAWTGNPDLFLENLGRLQGKGGQGGNGGGLGGAAVAGDPGGPAFLAEYPITIDNTAGEIWGGGGGGGGGGDSVDNSGGPLITAGGGGGGGGSGSDGPASAGGGGTGSGGIRDGDAGIAGSTESGGLAGAGFAIGPGHGGNGGIGGAPGQAGATGSTATGGNVSNQAGASGGATGAYIVGNSFVTWTAMGDVRGGVA